MNASKTIFFAVFHGKKVDSEVHPSFRIALVKKSSFFNWFRSGADFDKVMILLVRITEISLPVVLVARNVRNVPATFVCMSFLCGVC